MVFSSLVFLFHFLPLFLLLYYICPAKWKNAVLFAGSLIFYIYGVKNEPWYFFLFLLSVLVNYHIGLLLGRRRWLEHRKKWLIFGLCYNLIWLFLFKYSGFFAGNLNWIFKKWELDFPSRFRSFHYLSESAFTPFKPSPTSLMFIERMFFTKLPLSTMARISPCFHS